MREPYPEFARLLNHWLTVRDRTPNWLAHKLERRPSTVHRWSTQGTRPGDAATVQTILDILEIHNPADRQALFAAARHLDPDQTPPTAAAPSNPSANPTPALYEFATHDEGWVGREALVQELNEQIQSGRRLILLTGMAGIGKTALAERLALVLTPWLLAPSPISRLNFDHQERAIDFASVAARWLEEWGEAVAPEERSSPARLLPRLLHTLSSQRRLIIIDALEKALSGGEAGANQRQNRLSDEGWEQFFHGILSAEALPSRVIVTTQDLPEQVARFGAQYPNRWLPRAVGGLNPSEQEALFQKAGFLLNGDRPVQPYLARISQAYAGHPLALRTIIGEIVNGFGGDVLAYWQEYGHEIETVERDLAEALQTGRIQAADDNWRLDRYSVELDRQVCHRLDATFARLRQHAPDAYLLICAAAEYRTPVKTRFWLMQLAGRDKSEAQQQAALQTLRDRSLLEQSFDRQGNRLVGLHNLIRSMALEHYARLFPENITK